MIPENIDSMAGSGCSTPTCSLIARHLPFPLCREEGEIVIEGHPDDETKWIPHAQFLEILEELKRAAECVGGADIIRAGINRYLAANNQADQP